MSILHYSSFPPGVQSKRRVLKQGKITRKVYGQKTENPSRTNYYMKLDRHSLRPVAYIYSNVACFHFVRPATNYSRVYSLTNWVRYCIYLCGTLTISWIQTNFLVYNITLYNHHFCAGLAYTFQRSYVADKYPVLSFFGVFLSEIA